MPKPSQTIQARAECPKCSGIGLVRTGPNSSAPCDCQLEKAAQGRLKRAGFPPNFQAILTRAPIDTFKITDDNRAARIAASRYCAEFLPKQTTTGLMFAGPVGTGKTHIAIAIAATLIQTRGIEAAFVDVRELLDRLRSSYDSDSADSQAKILKPILEADLVVIDELGAARPSDWVFETQELLIGQLYNRMTPVIVTTNLANLPAGGQEPSSYQRAARPDTLGDRIGSRMFSRLQQMCTTVVVNGPDWRAKKR